MVEGIKSIKKFKKPPQFGGAVDLAAVAAAIRIGGVDSRWQIFCGQRSEKLDRVLSLGAPLAITR